MRQLRMTQDAFATALVVASDAVLGNVGPQLALFGIQNSLCLSGEDICRFECGARCPKRRAVYLLMAFALRHLGALQTTDSVNEWLDAAHQGWLTGAERRLMAP